MLSPHGPSEFDFSFVTYIQNPTRSELSRTALLNVGACWIVQLMDWVTFYGVLSSLTLFLRSDLNYSTDRASVAYTMWFGCTYLFVAFAGYIGDKYGQKRTIIVALIIDCISLTILSVITSLLDSNDLAGDYLAVFEGLFWISMVMQIVGNAGLLTNAAVFGETQLAIINGAQNDDFEEGVETVESNVESFAARMKKSYWNWSYINSYVGSLAGTTLIAYLCQDIAFYVGWSILPLLMLSSIVMFLWRNGMYHEIEKGQPALEQFVPITWYGMTHSMGPTTTDSEDGEADNHWLDVAKKANDGPFDNQIVEEIKSVHSLLGVVPFLIVYAISY